MRGLSWLLVVRRSTSSDRFPCLLDFLDRRKRSHPPKNNNVWKIRAGWGILGFFPILTSCRIQVATVPVAQRGRGNTETESPRSDGVGHDLAVFSLPMCIALPVLGAASPAHPKHWRKDRRWKGCRASCRMMGTNFRKRQNFPCKARSPLLMIPPRAARRMVQIAGWSSQVARQAHNLKVRGSNPLPATNESRSTSRS